LPLARPSVILEDNADLRAALVNKKLPKQMDLKIPVDGGFEAQVRLQLPADFNPELKYPLLINV